MDAGKRATVSLQGKRPGSANTHSTDPRPAAPALDVRKKIDMSTWMMDRPIARKPFRYLSFFLT